MEMKLTWIQQKREDSLDIFEGDKEIGYIGSIDDLRETTSAIFGKQLLFRDLGWLKRTTHIIDVATNRIIGEINYSPMAKRATVTINGYVSKWNHPLFGLSWMLTNPSGLRIQYKTEYKTEECSGRITSNKRDALQLIVGLYIEQYRLRIENRIALIVGIIALPATIATILLR